MAIDSKAKRASVIGSVIPDGTIAQFDRQAVLWIYGGILAGAAADENWYQKTVTFTHPYDSSITSYSAYKHASGYDDVYLSDDSGGSLGFGTASTGEIVASVYHDTGATPANTNLEFQGEVLGAVSQTGSDLSVSVAFSDVDGMSSTRAVVVGGVWLRAYDFDGANWTLTGNSFSVTSATKPSASALSASRVAYVDSDNDELRAYDFDGTDWTLTGNGFAVTTGFTVGYLASMSSSRVSFSSAQDDLGAYDFDGTDWALVGSQLSGVAGPSAALTEREIVVVGFQDGVGSIQAYSFDGSTWSTSGPALQIDYITATSAWRVAALSPNRIVIVEGVITSATQTMYLYQNDGAGWYEIKTATITTCGMPSVGKLTPYRMVYIDSINDDLRAYDLATTWTEISATAATANGEWEELSVAVTTSDLYDGYRLLIDSSEEYYVFRVMAQQTGYGNVNGSVLNIPADATVFLNSYENNSWTRADNAVESRVTQRTKTLTAKDAGLVYADPSASIVALTLPTPTKAKGLSYRIENRHYGNGLMANGDCESTEEPMVDGETVPLLVTSTFARSADFAHDGTYSYKMTATGAGTRTASFTDGVGTTDMHGFVAGATYTLNAWMYTPTTGGCLPAEALLVYREYKAAAWGGYITASPSESDVWQREGITFTVNSTATAVQIYLQMDAAAGNTEYFYVDDIQLYRHYDVTIAGPIEDQATKSLHNEGDFIELVSDGTKYLINDLQYFGRVKDALHLGGGEYQFPEDSGLSYSASVAGTTTITFTELPKNTRQVFVEFGALHTTGYPYVVFRNSSGGTNAVIVGGRYADGGTNNFLTTVWLQTEDNTIYIDSCQIDSGITFVILGYKVGE